MWKHDSTSESDVITQIDLTFRLIYIYINCWKMQVEIYLGFGAYDD